MSAAVSATAKPTIAHGLRLQWEPAQEAHVLLYPEGMVKLNGSAAAILSRCDGILCEAKTKIFLTKCVAASNVPEGFCASIPKRGEIIATAQWSLAECARRGHGGEQRCTRVITGLQDYCSSNTSASAISSPGNSGVLIAAPAVSVLSSSTRSYRPASLRR